jgi:hypothetical protein
VKCDQVQPPLPPPDRCRPCGRTATAPPGTHHLECRTVRSNTQSRRSGRAAALLPLSPTGWRNKPSKSHRRKAPKNEPDARGAVTLRMLPPPRKLAPTEERGPRLHGQHHTLEAEEERTGRLLIPLAATADREEKPNRTHRCSLPLLQPWSTKEERRFHLHDENQLLGPLLESSEQRSPPHLAQPTRALRGHEPPPAGPDLGQRSESPPGKTPTRR